MKNPLLIYLLAVILGWVCIGAFKMLLDNKKYPFNVGDCITLYHLNNEPWEQPDYIRRLSEKGNRSFRYDLWSSSDGKWIKTDNKIRFSELYMFKKVKCPDES
jgi:hypothetical protein